VREITTVTKVYFFNELNKEQQQKAIDNHRDINTDYEWYDFIFEDALSVGIKILSFDLYREGNINLAPTDTYYNASMEIRKKYNKGSELYCHADNYLSVGLDKILESKNASLFISNLEDYYLNELRKNYEYLMSDEAIKETLIANEYEFTQNGKIF
tara:strand:- start:30 stop:497 length:468 start_codon:yes stop_codon:yes gene_type:complete